MDKINQIWPSWHTVELIGRGGFGEVYKAKREQLGEVFYSAVKIIQIPKEEIEIKEMLAEGHTSESVRYYYESVVKGLLNEIRVMDSLKSAGNVVNIEEFEVREREDSIGWDAYIRMELLQSLNDYRKDHEMGQREVAKLGADLCEALICCEKSHIIHRDIKPSNIFVDKYGTFKLGDFGIARQMEKTQSTLSRKGTELYMAPEVRYGKHGSSYNVDIYSLGLVMYRLLNRNRMPFEPLDKELMSYQEREEALVRRLEGEAIPLPADCDPQLGMIVRKACEYEKEDRYQSAGWMKAALEVWLSKERFEQTPGKEAERRTENSAAKCTDETEKILGTEEKTVAAFGFDTSAVSSEDRREYTGSGAYAADKQSVNKEEPEDTGKSAQISEEIPKKEEPEILRSKEGETEKKARRAYLSLIICMAVPLNCMFYSTKLSSVFGDFPVSAFVCLAASGLFLCGMKLIERGRRSGRILCAAGGFLAALILAVIYNFYNYLYYETIRSLDFKMIIFSLVMSVLVYRWSGKLGAGTDMIKPVRHGETGMALCAFLPLVLCCINIIDMVQINMVETLSVRTEENALYLTVNAIKCVPCILIFLGKRSAKRGKRAGAFICAAGGLTAGYFIIGNWAGSFIGQALFSWLAINQDSSAMYETIYQVMFSGNLLTLISIAGGIAVAVFCYKWARALTVHK